MPSDDPGRIRTQSLDLCLNTRLNAGYMRIGQCEVTSLELGQQIRGARRRYRHHGEASPLLAVPAPAGSSLLGDADSNVVAVRQEDVPELAAAQRQTDAGSQEAAADDEDITHLATAGGPCGAEQLRA